MLSFDVREKKFGITERYGFASRNTIEVDVDVGFIDGYEPDLGRIYETTTDLNEYRIVHLRLRVLKVIQVSAAIRASVFSIFFIFEKFLIV